MAAASTSTHPFGTGVDLLRPLGGKYPGISSEVDRSILQKSSDEPSVSEADKEQTNTLGTSGSSISAPSSTAIEDCEYVFRSFDGKAVLRAEQLVVATSGTVDGLITLVKEYKVHKKSILRYFTDLRGHETAIPATLTWDARPPVKRLVLGGLFATFISHDSKGVALCIMQCTGIKLKSKLLDEAPIDEISLPQTEYDIGGQMFELVSICTVPESEEVNLNDYHWLWTSGFVALEKHAARKPASGTTSSRTGNLHFSVSDRIVLPLTEGLEYTSVLAPDTSSLSEKPNDPKYRRLERCSKTWRFENDELLKMHAALIKRCEGGDDVRGYASGMAYYDNRVKLPENGPRRCTICGHSVAVDEQQNHMGKHILRSQYGLADESWPVKVSPDYPCGFCGQSVIGVVNGKVNSKCPLEYPLRMKDASKSSKSRHSSNAPVQCKLAHCGEFHWKYSMEDHFWDRHPNWKELIQGMGDLQATIEITDEEKGRNGVALAPRPSRARQGLAPRRDRELPLSTRYPHNDSPRRPRIYRADSTHQHPVPAFTYHPHTIAYTHSTPYAGSQTALSYPTHQYNPDPFFDPFQLHINR
ncbi:hypothetical protein FA13DRAFT_1793735 [Coprinellus micaceus]|uniref:Uncharacterized protein n=1 Tax=Coprinellus micaceus TaxID=71717 RepID=A0A4Y7T404_COPMI|nr:hypothetical protein FA13DRAFT_1793735 [Coprinellus micaceus]